MKDFGKDIMKKVLEEAEKKAKKVIEDKLRPLQSEIRKEGAQVNLVKGQGKDVLFSVSIKGASEELQKKIKTALK